MIQLIIQKLLYLNCLTLFISFNYFKKYLPFTEINSSNKNNSLEQLYSNVIEQYNTIINKSQQESGEENDAYLLYDIKREESVKGLEKLKILKKHFLEKMNKKKVLYLR